MFAKVAILLSALAAVNASVLLGHGALVNTGVSASSRSQDAFGNYAFGYDIKDGLGATNSRSEVGDATVEGIPPSPTREGPDESTTSDGHGFEPSPGRRRPCAYGGVLGHRAALGAPVAYGGVLGHGAALAAPVAYGGVIGHGAALAAPVAYGGVLGHGAALGVGYGLGYGKALIH
ncbi:hypothetical protein AVEN_116098-1 [Araneus ventricosus]|uniref:Adult-specific rigid cuticular protein 15.7 n=1 Tax=Araneus ventricosus TaxID=182803 RepID=A0A4Y2M5W8_ARAVE|nr:hypothetical protein AVEN_116098-1 [Araneus ventricosus]